MARASETLLANLHNKVAQTLLDKIESGEATHQDMQAAIKFLKDNGIEATLDTPGMTQLVNALPKFEDQDEDVRYN